MAIIDHSIDIGTKKALVMLRVAMDALSQREGAIQLQDGECIGLRVGETVNGESIALELSQIFTQAGIPKAIIKDGDRTLNRGVNGWLVQSDVDIPVIEDIAHVMALALKTQFEQTDDYRRLTSLVSQGAKNLRPTALAFLTPPKLRTKGRFMSISRLGQWAENMLDVLAGTPTAYNSEQLDKLHAALPDFSELKPFISDFANTAQTLY